ncbi:MAG: PBSX family phage terminase large subunit [Clostridiales bacterium]|jgi:PBSX family phage terminase large subunit|nr:PBSX family phage terminase large subunit [Clostridiales bacterium]
MSIAPYTNFTAKQSAYLKRSLASWLNVAEGGKRAGKNILNIIAFAMNVESHPDKLHLAAGVTLAAARLNIIDSNGFGLRYFFAGRCREGKYEGKPALFVDVRGQEKIVIIEGGQKANDAARIKGISFGSIYISEANEVHKSFLFEALDRTLASRRRKAFFDINAKAPSHWFYREFLDRQEKLAAKGENKGFNYGNFTILDNLSVPCERLAEIMRSYDRASNWFLTDILGRRGGGDNTIYRGFGEGSIAAREEIAKMDFVKFAVGVDVGGTDATAATLVGATADKRLVLIDGYYHRQGGASGMTHERYIAEIVERLRRWCDEFPGLSFSGGIFCESAEKLFRQALHDALRREGLMLPVYPSYKKDGILERIRLFCLLIAQGRLLAAAHLEEWVDAFYSATWDETAKERGAWVRKDDGSYPLDCLDSAEYAAVPLKQMLT